MDRLSVFVIFSIIVGAASDVPLNFPVKEVHFKRLSNGSKEYEFEYDLDNGDKFRGQAYVRNTNVSMDVDIYFLFGAENEIYWTKIDRNEHKEGENFTQMVRKVQRSDDHLDYEDNHVKYYMTFDGNISVSTYLTEWNLSNICFTKGDKETFNFIISASNNLRKYNGTTYRDTDDPKVQLLSLKDAMKEKVYEIHFTDMELHSGEEFCRGYDQLIETLRSVFTTDSIMKYTSDDGYALGVNETENLLIPSSTQTH